jgi:prophage maintenance system killer protein
MTLASLKERTMQYLSVHDIVWINTTLAGKTLAFNYVTLEEAMAAQYSYGDSTNVPVQAANLLDILVRKRPFKYGNTRTGFIAVTAFLNANGYALKVDEAGAADLVKSLANGRATAADTIAALAQATGASLKVGISLRTLVTHIFNHHTEAVQLLAQGDE